MILAMFTFYLCLKQQDKHCIRHYDCEYDKKIRYKYGPLSRSQYQNKKALFTGNRPLLILFDAIKQKKTPTTFGYI